MNKIKIMHILWKTMFSLVAYDNRRNGKKTIKIMIIISYVLFGREIINEWKKMKNICEKWNKNNFFLKYFLSNFVNEFLGLIYN